MKNQVVLTREQLKCTVPQRTRDVYQAIGNQYPITANELQNKLNFPSKSIYYQIKKLLKAKLIKEIHQKGKATEYEPIAEKVIIPDGYQGPEYESLAAKTAIASHKKMQRLILRSAEESSNNPDLIKHRFTLNAHFNLSEEELKNMMGEVETIIEKYKKISQQKKNKTTTMFILSTAPEKS